MIPDWMNNAACIGTPESMWFLPEGARTRGADREPRHFCLTRCPVIGHCGTWVIKFESRSLDRKFGIYGGLTSSGRHRHQDAIRNMTPDQYAQWVRTAK